MATKFAKGRYMSDALLDGATQVASGVNAGGLVSNVSRSGQLGTGIRFTKLDAATPIVYSPATIIVMGMPEYFDKFPKMQEIGKSLIESHAKSVSGIDFGYTVGTEDTPVGHDGQTMKVPTRTMRGGVSPSFTIPEYSGNVTYEFFKQWMYFINDPDTNASALPHYLESENDIPGWTMNAYSMTIAVLQYDPYGLPDRLIDGCIITNMFPTDIGDIGFERSHATTKIVERTIAMTGLVQHNRNTYAVCVDIATKLELHKINYAFALPGVSGSTDATVAIQKELQSVGGIAYEAGSKNLGATKVDGSITQFKYGGANEVNLKAKDTGITATGAAEASATTNAASSG